MATLTQQPSEWNMAYMPNVFTVASSTGIAALRVLVNGVEVAVLKQTENPSGKCHFDVSKVLQSYLETSFVEETPLVTQSNGEVLSYRVQYGEVPTGGGLPVYSGYSLYKYVINGYSNWRDLNWNSATYVPNAVEFECEVPGYSAHVNSANYLTNYPTAYQIADNEYHTLSFVNKINNPGLAYFQEQPYFAVIKFYNASDALIGENIYALSDASGLGPRTDCNDLGAYSYTVNELIGHIGAGPQNLKDAGIWVACDHYTVNIYPLDGCYYIQNGPISDCDDIGELADYVDINHIYTARFDVTEYCTPFEPIRLSFINQYGMKDYYTFDKRNTYTVETKRTNYLETLGTWEASTFIIPQQGHGFRTFASEIAETMSLSTDWIDTDVAVWMQELFTSPAVMIYKSGQWEPCVITSNTYQEMTKARQKLFRYEISVQYSNTKKVQRG